MSNTFFPGLAAPQGTAQSPAAAGGTGSLLDFIGVLLGTQDGETALATDPALQEKLAALLQNLPAEKNPQGTADLPLLQQLLALTGGAQKTESQSADPLQALLKILKTQGGIEQAQLPPDTLQKITALIEGSIAQRADSPIRPGLTRDLTVDTAVSLQEAPELPTVSAKTVDAPLPVQNVQERVSEIISRILADETGAPPAGIDTKILAELKLKMDSADVAFTREDTIAFLKDKGLDDAAIQQNIKALETLPPVQSMIAAFQAPPQLDGVDAEHEDIADAPLKTGTKSADTNVESDTPEQATKTLTREKPDAAALKPQGQEQAVKDEKPLPQSLQQANAADPKQAPAKAAAHPATVNAMAHDAALKPNIPTAPVSVTGTADQAVLPATAGPSFVNLMSTAETAAPASTTQMVAVQLQSSAAAKVESMTIHLAPAELGRLDIKLSFEKDGSIKAHLLTDRPETLALLRQDSTHLHRALQQAGFETDDSSLSFDLRQDAQQQHAGGTEDNASQGNNGNQRSNAYGRALANDLSTQAYIPVQTQGYISQSGVNIMV